MAIIIGTAGDDTLTGTAADDVITPLFGYDFVNGGLGRDILTVDYSSLAESALFIRTSIFFDGISFNGKLDGLTSSTQFEQIEALNYKAPQGNDAVYVSLAAKSAALKLDGGAGFDTLIVDTAQLTDFTFLVSDLGSVTSDLGAFSNWESFRIVTPEGSETTRGLSNTVIVTGQNDDLIFLGAGLHSINTRGGNDTINVLGSGVIDGGLGNDRFTYSTTEASLHAKLTNTYVRTHNLTVSNVEDIYLAGTVNADDIKTDMRSGGNQEFYGDAGQDSIAIDLSGQSGFERYTSFRQSAEGEFTVALYAKDLVSSPINAGLIAREFENVTMKLNDTDNDLDFVFNRVPASSKFTISIDGQAGSDSFRIYGQSSNSTLLTDANGTTRIFDNMFGATMSSPITLINMEYVQFDDRTLVLNNFGQGRFFVDYLGTDKLGGTEFADRLAGLEGNDIIFGNAGNDLLNGGAGSDLLNGGDGIDTATFTDASRSVTVNLALTTAQFTGDGKDTLINIENLIGSAFADGLRGDGGVNILDGLLGNDNLFGFGGADTLIGGEGADRLDGGDGADILRGGLGRDVLTGGADADTFVFDTLAVTPQPDTIRDFASGIDEIALSKSVFAALTGDTLATSAFHVGTRATTVDQHIIYNSATGALFYDADGVGGTAQIQIAQLTARPMIDANDFILI